MRSGLQASFCCLMRRHSRRLWLFLKRWKVRKRRNLMQVLFLTAGAGHSHHLQLIMPLICRRLGMQILAILIDQIQVPWNKKGTVLSTANLHLILTNYKLKTLSQIPTVTTQLILANTISSITRCFSTFKALSNRKSIKTTTSQLRVMKLRVFQTMCKWWTSII